MQVVAGTSYNHNPQLQAIEDTFNPDEQEFNHTGIRSDEEDYEEVLRDGVFIKRNLNIAPFYKQYK